MNKNDKNVAKAEVKVASFLVQNYIPVTTAGHLTLLLKVIVPIAYLLKD